MVPHRGSHPYPLSITLTHNTSLHSLKQSETSLHFEPSFPPPTPIPLLKQKWSLSTQFFAISDPDSVLTPILSFYMGTIGEITEPQQHGLRMTGKDIKKTKGKLNVSISCSYAEPQ